MYEDEDDDFFSDHEADYYEGSNDVGVFQYCSELKTVRLPESLREIGANAFYSSGLVHVDIPSGVNEIGEQAFEECYSLETATIPEGVVRLPCRIFAECDSLKSVKLPSSLRSIGDSAFYDCSALTTINEDGLVGLLGIGDCCFSGCSSLTMFKWPLSIQWVSKYTFADCKSLTKVELHPNVYGFMEFAFSGCKNLTIDVPGAICCAQMSALRDCRIRLPTIMSMLTNVSPVGVQHNLGQNLIYLLDGVKDVVMSSRMELEHWIEYLRSIRVPLPGVNPNPRNVRFKVLHCCSTSTTSRPSLDIEHIPESLFYLDISPKKLMLKYEEGGENSVRLAVERSFMHKLATYAALLQCKAAKLPVEMLYNILPFVCGEELDMKVLESIVGKVNKLLGMVPLYAELLQCKAAKLPEEMLYNILPFVCGEELDVKVLESLVRKVKTLLGSLSASE